MNRRGRSCPQVSGVREQVAVAVVVVMMSGSGCALERSGSRAGAVDKLGALDAGPTADGSAPNTVDASDAADELDGSGPPFETASTDAAPLDGSEPDAGPPALCSNDPALVACYPLDGDALDHGPRGNHLDATAVAWNPGGGVLLNSGSGLVRAHRAELSHADTTLLLWVRVDAMPASGRAGVLDHDGQYGIFVHPSGELRCALGIAGAGVMSAPAALEEGQWHHVACVAEAATSRLYVDGIMVASAPGTTTRTAGATPLHLGENAPTGDDQLVGAIDDVRIWEADWTATQVAADALRGHAP